MPEGKKWQAYMSYGIYGIPPGVDAFATADTLRELLIHVSAAITPKLTTEMEADEEISIDLSCGELPQ